MEVSIGVVIPCYKVSKQILDLVNNVGAEVSKIFVIDDFCPEHSGDIIEAHNIDPRVRVIRNPKNLGVGGAVMAGYKAAISEKLDIIVKMDGDGQMDPSLILDLIQPILKGEADYTKGNRFYDLEQIKQMPRIRLLGNAVLSFMAKLSTGYWNIFDTTNGFTAIHANIAKHLPLEKISNRFFFETDILFRLNILKAVVVDVPMDAKYSYEKSNLKIRTIIGEFLYKHGRNFIKRIFYNYYLRDLSLASFELPCGLIMLGFGLIFGAYHLFSSMQTGILTNTGTVMLSCMPIIVGLQLILAFLGADITSVPQRPRHYLSRFISIKKKSAFNIQQNDCETINSYKDPK